MLHPEMQHALQAAAAKHHCRFCQSVAIFPRSLCTRGLGADFNTGLQQHCPDQEPFIWPKAGRISFVPQRNLHTGGSPTQKA